MNPDQPSSISHTTPPAPVTRAKFRLDSRDGNSYTFRAVVGGDDSIPEDQTFHKYTPSGLLQMTIDNEAVAEKLSVGEPYYLDITPAFE